MKINSHTKLVGKNIILIPYKEHHVKKYHEWMKSEELQKLTASEPLTLDEEYEMQNSWMKDEDKCTFIILDKEIYDRTKNEIEAMIGDTNIFIKNRIEFCTGEIEIMIAEIMSRGKKYGWEAVMLMLIYGIKYININIYEAKISIDNTISIKMFNKLGFVEKSRSRIFNEVTLEKNVSSDWIEWLENATVYKIKHY